MMGRQARESLKGANSDPASVSHQASQRTKRSFASASGDCRSFPSQSPKIIHFSHMNDRVGACLLQFSRCSSPAREFVSYRLRGVPQASEAECKTAWIRETLPPALQTPGERL